MRSISAVDPDGHRRLLAITLGPEESEDSWSGSSSSSWSEVSAAELVIADEQRLIRRQRCTVHLQRNVLAKVPGQACGARGCRRLPGPRAR